MQKSNPAITVIILSETGKVNENNLRAASAVGSVYLLHPPGIEEVALSGITTISAQPSIPAALNRICSQCGSEFMIVMDDDVELNPAFAKSLAGAPPEAGLLYGNYRERISNEVISRRSYEGPEDITERAELGPVLAYRVEAVKRVGGWIESLRYTYDYDLRLKLGERGKIHHIDEETCTLYPEMEMDDDAAKLFFPGRGKYGGFSYLFLEPEQEREIERVFLQSLKRRGAYLEGEAPPMKPEPLTSPLVSVITPVYNRERFIGQAIESVLDGKFGDFEYIIVDNGSTDDTCKVVEKYTKDNRIRLIRNNINRIALSLNIAVNAARSKYISQLDSDDLYTENTLQFMIEFMEQSNSALGISYYSLINESGEDLPEFGIIKHLEYSRNNILRVDGAGAVRMWRRSAILEFGGFDEKDLCDYGEDYDLVLKVGEKYRISRVHEVLYKYRRHPDNSDVRRDPLFKLRNKNLARARALVRRITLNKGK